MATIQCRDVRFENIAGVIFDKDGTLANGSDYWLNLGRKRARLVDAVVPGVGEPLSMAFGIDGDRMDPSGLLAVGSRRENEIAAAAYIAETGRGWLASLEMARQAFAEADAMLQGSPAPLFPGCGAVIKSLAAAGLKLGILSADTTVRVRDFARFHQLDSDIQLLMGVDGGTIGKPDPSLFLAACESLGVAAGVTLMVGDSPADMQMANNAGAAGCIGIRWGASGGGDVPGAGVTIASLDEMKIIS